MRTVAAMADCGKPANCQLSCFSFVSEGGTDQQETFLVRRTCRFKANQTQEIVALFIRRHANPLHRVARRQHIDNYLKIAHQNFAFLHVGKAGGSSLCCALVNGADNFFCKGWLFSLDIPPLSTAHFEERIHMGGTQHQTNQSVFLVSLRDLWRGSFPHSTTNRK
jgi:hypothetical protein